MRFAAMQPQFDQLAEHEKKAFNLYKANSCFAGEQYFADFMNQNLREMQDMLPAWAEKMATLDSIIEKGSLDCASTLFRATVDLFVSPFISGNELIYPAYMSTALSEDVVQPHWSGHWRNIPAALLCIKCPGGAIALDLEINSSFGGHEDEFLLPRNAKFIVSNVHDVTDRMEMNQRMSEFYARSYSFLRVYELSYVGRT
jgi:hypothetical protein